MSDLIEKEAEGEGGFGLSRKQADRSFPKARGSEDRLDMGRALITRTARNRNPNV